MFLSRLGFISVTMQTNYGSDNAFIIKKKEQDKKRIYPDSGYLLLANSDFIESKELFYKMRIQVVGR